ncbi:putative hydroxymethylpyrimidine transporter CytX [soil metagenome]
MWQRLASKFGNDTIDESPQGNRTMGFGKAVTMWLGANVVVTTILTGMLLVPDLPYLTALWIVLVGSVIGAVGLALVGNMGTRTGLPTMVLSRGAFGIRGSNLPAAVNLVILVGWSWVQALLAGMSMNYSVNATFGYSNLPLFTILCEVIVVLIVLRGHVGIERMEFLVATSMLILAAVVFYKLFTEFSVGNLLTMEIDKRNGITAAIAFDIVLATAFSWYVLAADFNRHAKTQAGGMGGTMIGYVVATLVAMGLGATVSGFSILRGMEQTFDPTVLLSGFGFGIPAALVIFLSVMTTNVMAVYGAVMSYLNIRPQDAFWKPALAIGIITVLGALWTGILDQFQNFLLLIGTLFIPVFAIMLADYWIVKRGNYDAAEVLKRSGGEYWYTGGYNVAAWIAYLIGAGAAFYWTQISPLSFGATLPSFVLTFVLYLIVRALLDRFAQRSPAPTSGFRK